MHDELQRALSAANHGSEAEQEAERELARWDDYPMLYIRHIKHNPMLILI